MFRGSVKSTGHPLHSPVSPSLPPRVSPCAYTFQLYFYQRLGRPRGFNLDGDPWSQKLLWNDGTHIPNPKSVVFQKTGTFTGTAVRASQLAKNMLIDTTLFYFLDFDMIYLLTAIGLSPGGSSTVHIYTQTIHRTIQNKQYIEQHNNFGRVRAVPRLG